MAQNFNLGTLGQVVSVNTAANTVSVDSSIVIGNSSSNVVINSTSVYVGGAPLAGTNTDSQFTWTNTQTFSNTITFNSTIVGTVNNANYLNGNSASDLRTYSDNKASNAYSNAVSYVDTSIGTVNTAITSNASAAYTNATSYADTKAGTAYSNATSYADTKASTAYSNAIAYSGNAAQAYSNATSYADTKAATAYSNATSYVDGKAYVNTSQLSSNLSNYAALSGASFTGAVTITGNLTVSGNVTTIGANNLSVVDNMIYLNANNTVTNPDLGFTGNYNDGTYHHAGFFRDATDGVWKVFDNYGPEPDASPYIDTTNTTFHIADFQANTVKVGNTTVYSTINTTSFTGTSNNSTYAFGKSESGLNVNNALTANSASYLGSTAAAGYQTTAGLSANVATLSANAATYLNGKTEGNLNVNNALTSNNSSYLGGTAAASYLTTSTAASTYAALSGATFSGDVRTYRTASTTTGVYYFSQSGDKYLYYDGANFTLNGGYVYNANSFRAPIFYDSDDTNYYVNPASSSVFSTAYATNFRATNAYYLGDNNYYLNNTNSGWYSNVKIQSGADMRAPIFYDSDNTGYYVDPNSTSNLYRITLSDGNLALTQGDGTGLRITTAYGYINFGAQNSSWTHVYSDKSFYTNQNWYVNGNLMLHDGNAPRARGDYLMYYQGFTLDANSMGTNTTGFTYSVNAPYTGPIARFSAGGSYDLWLNAPYSSGGYGLAFRTQNGDSGSINNWQYPAIYGINVNGGGALYSTVYYDQNNTSYYLDPTGSTSLVAAGVLASFRSDTQEIIRTYNTSASSAAQFYIAHNYGAVTMGNSRGTLDISSTYTTISNSTRSPIFYDSDNTGYYVDPASTSKFNESNQDGWHTFNNNGVGITGLYDSYRLQTIFAMGSAYRMANDGTATNNMYGLAWSHPNAGSLGGANNLNDHGLLIINNGSFRAAISSRAVFSSDVRGTMFYDYENTNYYVNPNGTSQLAYVLANDWFRPQGASGVYWQDYGRGIRAADIDYSYGNIGLYGGGKNGWTGYGVYGNNCVLMANGSNWGFYNPQWGWLLISDMNGNTTFGGNVTAYSDLRLKENVREIDNIVERRNTLAKAAIKYEREGRTRIGYAAQTLLHNGCPEFVLEADDAMKLASGLGTLSVDYGETAAVLAVTSKLTDDRVSALEAEIVELKNIVRKLIGE